MNDLSKIKCVTCDRASLKFSLNFVRRIILQCEDCELNGFERRISETCIINLSV